MYRQSIDRPFVALHMLQAHPAATLLTTRHCPSLYHSPLRNDSQEGMTGRSLLTIRHCLLLYQSPLWDYSQGMTGRGLLFPSQSPAVCSNMALNDLWIDKESV